MKFVSLMSLIPVVLITASCATTNIVDNADKIEDTGKANTVVLSYDIKLKSLSRHPQTNVATARLCQDSSDKSGFFSGFGRGGRCFSMPAEFTGTVASEAGVMLETFSTASTNAHQKKYGEYTFREIEYSVVVGKRPETVCSEQIIDKKKNLKKTVCNTTMKDEFQKYKAALPTPLALTIKEGSGCYFGHIRAELTGDDLTVYEYRDDLEMLDVTQLPEAIREKIKTHVSRSCSMQEYALQGALQ